MEEIIESKTLEKEIEIKVTKKQIKNCMINNWYPKFKEVALEVKTMKLPPNFIEYLLEDGTVLPKDTFGCSKSERLDSDIDEEEWKEEDCSEEQVECPSFPLLENEIQSTIKEFGSVLPKLNWSTPRVKKKQKKKKFFILFFFNYFRMQLG